MDGKIKKLTITPVSLDGEGVVKKEEHATITLEIPMDTVTSRAQIAEILPVISKDWLKIEITAVQPNLPHIQPEDLPQESGIQTFEEIPKREEVFTELADDTRA